MKYWGLLKKVWKRLWKKFYQSYKKKLQNRYYNDVYELPVLNWWKLHETNDFKWLLKDKNKKVNKYAENKFKAVRSEFIALFGIDKKYEDYLNKLIKLTLLEIDICLNKDKSKKIFADLLELELKDMLNEEEKDAFNDNGFSAVSKFVGGNIKISEISVYEFYSHIKAIERHIKYLKDTDGIR